MNNYWSISEYVSFNVDIVVGCPDATLSSPVSNSFISDPDVYYETYAAEHIRLYYSDDNLVSVDSTLHCWPYIFTWEMSKDGGALEPLDPSVFILPGNSLKTYTTDASKAGVYEITYTVELMDYPSATPFTNSAVFKVNIVDACGPAASLVVIPPSSLGSTSQYYYTGQWMSHDVST